jgi:hypothetical protein
LRDFGEFSLGRKHHCGHDRWGVRGANRARSGPDGTPCQPPGWPGPVGYLLSPFGVLAFLTCTFFARPDWRSLDDPTFLMVAVSAMVIGTFGLIAFPQSWYAVQSAVESLVAEARRSKDRRAGTTLSEIAGDDETRRIFCATDLKSGSHVYLSHDIVLTPDATGTSPSVYLADVVAASACFPGFRPLVFNHTELGLDASSEPARARRRRTGWRLFLGAAGAGGIALAAVATCMRVFGPLDRGWRDFAIALVLVVAGILGAALAARILHVADGLVLVDGGVCDNLGAAFAILSKDNRYPALPSLATAGQPGLMLVVDASKPFNPHERDRQGLGDLVPLRLRGAQRSVLKLLGNANSAARRHVIELLLKTDGPVKGAIVSITHVPTDSEGLDWTSVVAQTSSTPTTLSPLEIQTVRNLILQSYRLTQGILVREGVTIERKRSVSEINALVGGTVPTEVHKVLRHGHGPYARQASRVRAISYGTYTIASAATMIGAIWWWWGR